MQIPGLSRGLRENEVYGSQERSKQRAIQEGSKEEGERDMGSVMTDLRMPS